MNLFKNYLTVSRANIQIASLPTATLGIILALQDMRNFFNISILLFILLFFIVLTYSCNINCMYDLKVDQKFKKKLSDAVKAIGIKRLNLILKFELLFACLIIISLCFLKRDIIYLFALGGIVFGYTYSAPPMRIKKRGILSPVPVMFGLYFLPIIAGWFIVRNRLSVYIILFGLGYAMLMQGITFINTCEDFAEDKSSGIRTLAHVLGIRKTLFLGAVFVSVGGSTALILVLLHKLQSNNIKLIPFISVLVLSSLFILSVFNISKALFIISKSKNPVVQSKKEAFKMPKWFMTTRYPLLLIALLFFL